MEDILEIESPEVQEPTQQPEPPIKKLYKVVKGKGLYTKSYDEFVKQYSTPEAKDKLHKVVVDQGLYTKSRQDFDAQYFPSSKKKVARVDFEGSSLEAGNVLSQSGGVGGTTPKTETFPTIEMYQTPTGDLTEDPFAQVKKSKELLGKTKVVSKGGIGGMGMGTTGTEIVPDEEATKEAKKIQEELKRTGYKEDFFAGISDLPEDAYNNPATSKETLSVLYKNNPVKFTQLTNEAKNKYAIRDAAAKKAYDEAQGDDKQKTEYASRVGILKGNEYSGDEIAPPENMQQFYDIVRQKQQLIDQNIDSPEEKKKAHERLRQTYAQAINPTSLDFREEYQNSGYADKMDVNQYAGLKTLELFEPEKAKALRSVIDAQITPQWNVNVQVTPEEQVRSIVTDSAMAAKMGGTISELTTNQRIAKEEVFRELSLIGATNEYDSIVSEQNDLKNKYKEAQTDEEKANIYAKMLLNEQRANDLQQTEAKNDERYPITAKLKMDNLVKEIVQDRGIGVGGWMWNKYTHGVGAIVDVPNMIFTNWFGSEKEKTDLRMKLIGEGKQFEASIYLPESERGINSPVIIQASDELKKKAKEILNGRSLSELSADERNQLSQLVADNQDQIKTITNPEAGKSKNFWSKATGMTIAGFTSDMGAFLTKMGLMQGVGMGAKAAEATTLFMDGYEPAFNKKLSEGASVEAANEYGILHGAVLSLMSKFGSKYETIKNVVKGGNSPISKYIAGLSEESWNKLAGEAKPFLSRVGKASKDIIKEQGKMIGTFGVAAPVASALADNLFYDEGRSVKEIADEVPLIAKEMAIGGIGFGLFGLARGVMKTKATPVEKAALFEMADFPELGKMRIDEAVKNREISKEEGERKKGIIDNVSRLVEQVPEVNDKGKPLNDQQRANYLFNLAVKESQKEKAKTLPEKQAEEAKQKALVADKENQIELEALTEKQLNDRKDKLEKAISKLDEKGKPELSDKEMADAKAELEAVNNIIKSKGDTTKTEEKLPKLSEPIEGVDEFGVPIGENVPPEVKGEPEQITQPIELSVEPSGEVKPLTKEAEDLLASIGEGSKPTFITKNLERIAKENGIEVTNKMSADDVINALKEKQSKPTDVKSEKLDFDTIPEGEKVFFKVVDSSGKEKGGEIFTVKSRGKSRGGKDILVLDRDRKKGSDGNQEDFEIQVDKEQFDREVTAVPKSGGKPGTDVVGSEKNKELANAFPQALELNDKGELVERGTKEGESEFAAMGRGILGYNEQYWDALKNNTNPKELDTDKLNFLREKYNEGKIKSLVDVFTWGNKKGREIHEKYEISENKPIVNEKSKVSVEPPQEIPEPITIKPEENAGVTEPVTKPISEVTETAKEQGTEKAVPEGTIETGRTEPEGVATVLEGGRKKGITHAAVEEFRKIIGEPEYEGRPTERHTELIEEAQKTIAENPNAALDVIEKMESQGEVSNKDNAIAAVYKATLDAEIERNPTKELLKQAKRLAKALDVSGTKLGKALESRKLIGEENNLANFLMQKEAAQGTELTENQIKEQSAKYNELKEAKEALEKQLEAEREQHKKDIAELGLNKAKAKARKEAKKTDAEYKAERKSAVEAAREALKQIRETPQASAAPLFRELVAIAPHVKEYLNSLVSQGVDKLDNIISEIHAEFKDVLDGLTTKNVLDILAGEYDEKKTGLTKNETAATVRLLQREAKLIKELADAKKGLEKAKTEEKVIESNRRIDELKEKIKEVKRLNKEGTEKEPVEDLSAGSNEDVAKYEEKLLRKIDKLNKDLKEGNYLKEPEKEPIFKKTRKAQILEDRVIDLENKIRHERSKDEYNKRSKWRKGFDKVMEVLGVRRLVQSALDISVPFRQGATMLSPRKIDVWAKGFRANLQSIFNPKKFERIMHEIRNDPMYHEMKKDNVVFNDMGSADPNLHNEDFRKSFIYKIPILSEPLKASNRSADAFLNVARYEMYKKLRANLEKKGFTREADPKAFKYIGNWVMSMTGRGKMHSALEKPAMNAVLGNTFYGARLMASRLNLLNPVTYFDPRIPKEVRYEAMKDMAAFTSTMMTVATALAYTTGAKISLNPDDSDFLQLRYGNKVYDISGGLANYVRTGLRIMKAGYTKATGTKYEGRESTKKAGESVVNFFRNKLSPNTSYAVDAFFGGRYGKDFDPSDIYRIYPMYTEDFIKAWKEEGGILATSTVLVPNIIGIGYGSYASKGQIDATLEDLQKRNMRSDEMDKEKIHNYKDGGRPITIKEFEKFADKRDELIEKNLKILFEKGVGKKLYKDLTPEEVQDEIKYIKSKATSVVKEAMFGQQQKTDAEMEKEIETDISRENNYNFDQ